MGDTHLRRSVRVGLAVPLMPVTGVPPGLPAASDRVTVFAAASATNAVTAIGELFASRGGERVVPSFASSSTLANQIENGAPADIYISANETWMDYLQDKRRIETGTRVDLAGVLTAWVLARLTLPGKTILDGLIHLPLVLPPVVIGYPLLVGFGRNGLLGAWLYAMTGLTLAFYTLTQVPGGETGAMRLCLLSVLIAMGALAAAEGLARRFTAAIKG